MHARMRVRPAITLPIVFLIASVWMAAAAGAGSADALLTVSATVISNCRRDGPTVVCTKGSLAPRTQVSTDSKAAAANGLTRPIGGYLMAPAGSWTSPADRPRTILVTVHY